jgi:hypothetical protein
MKPRNRKGLRMLKGKSPAIIDHSEQDKAILDQIIRTLYDNSDKATLNLDNDIYKPLGINLPDKEYERLWEVMLSTGLISPVVGFGNSGKVELSHAGYQLMTQFGSYKNYVVSMQNNHGPQTVILPIQIEGDQPEAVSDEEEMKKEPLIKKAGKKAKRA